ncbi:hypothetical protein AB9K35_17010 [Leisingera sp. XS_AS12]|uniref:hypothetical protein n=1 Tax=Leisingera sp. XS_AS12 TaxID=3241294 RepID=UPI0035173981
MPYITTRKIPIVSHIGHLARGSDERKPSVDGPGVAVSTCPELWRSIKGLNGPEYVLEYPPAEWIDVMSFNGSDIDELTAWMRMKRYMEPAQVWSVTWYDEDAGDFSEFKSLNRAEAAAKVGRTLEQEIAAAMDGAGATDCEDSFVLTRRAMARLGGVQNWPDPLQWFDAAVLLYAREVVLPKRPFVMGVWWDQPRNAEAGVADYGVLFPERAHLFEIEDEEGEVRSFSETFPEFAPDKHAGVKLLDKYAAHFQENVKI